MPRKNSEEEPEVLNISDANRTGAATAPTGKKSRISGRMANPVYLIHNGQFEVTVPAETRERLVVDEEDERYGQTVVDVVVPEYTAKGPLPKGTHYGSRKVGVPHEIWDAAEAEALKARGFQAATTTEVKRASELSARAGQTTDELAARERERAFRNLQNFGGRRATKDSSEDEGR